MCRTVGFTDIMICLMHNGHVYMTCVVGRLVESVPVLWDKSHIDFKDGRGVKRNNWVDVATVHGGDACCGRSHDYWFILDTYKSLHLHIIISCFIVCTLVLFPPPRVCLYCVSFIPI